LFSTQVGNDFDFVQLIKNATKKSASSSVVFYLVVTQGHRCRIQDFFRQMIGPCAFTACLLRDVKTLLFDETVL